MDTEQAALTSEEVEDLLSQARTKARAQADANGHRMGVWRFT